MAEPAQQYGPPQALSPPKDIKEEVQNILDGLDFSMQEDDDIAPATTAGESSHNSNAPPDQQETSAQDQSAGQAPQQNDGQMRAVSVSQSIQSTGSPQATKRPLEDSAQVPVPEAKRVKTEAGPEVQEEPSFEDGLAMLVQNALDSANNMMDEPHADAPIGEAGASTQKHDVFPEPDPIAIVDDAPPAATALMPPSISFTDEPERFVRTVNVRALGNLSLSLLLILCQELSEETMPKIRDFSSGHAGAFLQLRVSFEAVRGLVSRETSISADELGIDDADSRRILDFANMARLAIWLVESSSKYLAELDKNFLSLFGTQISDLPSGMSHLYIEIKTQRALDAIAAKDTNRKPEDITKEIFVDGLEERLKAQHNNTELTDADNEFLKKAKARHEELVTHATDSIPSLREKYPSEVLLRTFSTYIKGRLAACSDLGVKLGIALPTVEEVGVEETQAPATEPEPEPEPEPETDLADEMDLDDLSSFFEKTTSGLVQNALAGFNAETGETVDHPADQSNGDLQMNGNEDYMSDYKALEALVAESTSNYVRNTLDGLTPAPYQPTVPQSTAEAMVAQNNQSPFFDYNHQPPPDQYYSYIQQPMQDQQQQPQQQQQPGPPGANLPPNQTFPSAILYDKARQAALSKTSQHTRREGLHSTRRPWTQEEEKALMAGLDMVKGPHWSQILTLFGVNGTISDILKDRTQVQLKDKARNLKLFFLKTNSEMPYYLQAVTGELKTRAPSQAARKEAEERARLNSEEDQAKLQGIMTLAGGLQHPPQNRTSASTAKSMVQNVVTPAQAASAAAHAAAQRKQMAAQGTGATAGAAGGTANPARSVVPGVTQYHTASAPHNNIRPQSQGLPGTRPPMPQTAQGMNTHLQGASSSQAASAMQPPGQPKAQMQQTISAPPQVQHQGQTQNQLQAQSQSQPTAQPQSSPSQQVRNILAQVQQTPSSVSTARPGPDQSSGQKTPGTLPLPAAPAQQIIQQPQQPGQAGQQQHSQLALPPQATLQDQSHQQSSASSSTLAPGQATQVPQSQHSQATQHAHPASAPSVPASATPDQSQRQAVQPSSDRSSISAPQQQPQPAQPQSSPPASSNPPPASLTHAPGGPTQGDAAARPDNKEGEESSEATLLKGLQAAIAEAS